MAKAVTRETGIPENIDDKLLRIQTELKAPKGQSAIDFKTGKTRYKYRSCEDILEAVKPILKKYGATITLTDELVYIGDRYYIKATAKIQNTSDSAKDSRECIAYAREVEENGRMDPAQITGATSSYARKYALNGLLLIDDTRDVDTNEFQEEKEKAKETPQKRETAAKKTQTKEKTSADAEAQEKAQKAAEQPATENQLLRLKKICEDRGGSFDIEGAKKAGITLKQASDLIIKYTKGE